MSTEQQKYYVSGVIADMRGHCEMCTDEKAQFWSVYEKDTQGKSSVVFDCHDRLSAESAMMHLKAMDQLQEQVKALAAENVALKESREVLSKNSLEACNEVYCAGYRNTALHDGLMQSTGNRNAYPNPIRTMVDEATKQLATPFTDAFIAEIKAQGLDEFKSSLEGVTELWHPCDVAEEFAAQLRAKPAGEAE